MIWITRQYYVHWITADTVNDLHTYLLSSACPFEYCLPYSSHHKLSDPDSQCQFNRSGVLCGQCKQGLSSVFGSSEYKHCSNIYILLVIPIAINSSLVATSDNTFLVLFETNGIINSFCVLPQHHLYKSFDNFPRL